MKSRILAVALCMVASVSMADEIPSSIPTKKQEAKEYHVQLDKLPKPFATPDVSHEPRVEDLPKGKPSLNVPDGFSVTLFAHNLQKPRWLVVSPEGDVLVTETYENRITRLIDADKDGVAEKTESFAAKDNGLNQPFGMAFDDSYFYLANTDEVRRYAYKKGDRAIKGKGEQLTKLPGGGYNQHWTRNVILHPNKEWLYVSVGSESNVSVEEEPRATIIRMRPDGSERKTYASGLRNPIGLAFNPHNKHLYAAVNERDKLGDDLVPDYITQVQEGGFYGWPYAYLKADNLDPRRMKGDKSEEPGIVARTITPDLLLEAHSAVMNIVFSEQTNFPDAYKNGIFATLRGSWNRGIGTGYKLIFAKMDVNGKLDGKYQDFLTGFVIDPEHPKVWGRPVGLTAIPDGSLLFADEPNGRLYNIRYTGTKK